jgi:hypothetical protein
MTGPAVGSQAREALDALARDIERLESLRAIKDLQRCYALFCQSGEWQAMASCFAEQGELHWCDEAIAGRPAIEAWLEARAGGKGAIARGSLHTEIIDQPLATLSRDGTSATVRWMAMRFLGDGKGTARIEGGLYVNDYALEGGCWRITRMRYHPQYEGGYAEGWANIGGRDLPIVPYHFTSDESGVPILPPAGIAPPAAQGLDALAARVQRLNDEDAVRNLQNAFGYYVDRRMWSDAVDLFAEDCAAEPVPGDVYRGKQDIRRALERTGPEGLSSGELNECRDCAQRKRGPGQWDRDWHARRHRASARRVALFTLPQPLRQRRRLVETQGVARHPAGPSRLSERLGKCAKRGRLDHERSADRASSGGARPSKQRYRRPPPSADPIAGL